MRPEHRIAAVLVLLACVGCSIGPRYDDNTNRFFGRQDRCFWHRHPDC